MIIFLFSSLPRIFRWNCEKLRRRRLWWQDGDLLRRKKPLWKSRAWQRLAVGRYFGSRLKHGQWSACRSRSILLCCFYFNWDTYCVVMFGWESGRVCAFRFCAWTPVCACVYACGREIFSYFLSTAIDTVATCSYFHPNIYLCAFCLKKIWTYIFLEK